MFSLARRRSSRSPATTKERSPASVSRQSGRVGLEGAIGDELLEQLGQVDVLDVPRAGVAFGPGELEQLVDQVVEPIGLLVDPRQGRLAVGAGLGQLDGESQPGQRRAELVRDVLEQPSLGRQQRGDLVGHAVERLRQLADLVATRQVIADAQVAPAEFLHDPAQAP